MRAGTRYAATGLALLGAVLIPPVAQAGGPGPTVSLGKSNGLHYYKATHVDVVSQIAQPVHCGGADVTGGGGSISGPPASSALNESYPMGGTDWQVEASSTAGARKLTGYAICDPNGQWEYMSSQSALPENGAVIHGSAVCGGSSQPIGGGGGATGAGIRLIASSPMLPPSTAGWRASASNPTPNDTLFDSYAICGQNFDVRYRESQPTKLESGESGTATAACKPDEAVLGGGFWGEQSNVTGYRMLPTALRPWDSKDKKKVPDDGFLAKALNSESFKVKLVALAVCRKP